MAKFRIVRTDFWSKPMVCEEMTPEDKFFMLYLHTNPYTTQTGIYKITKKHIAFECGSIFSSWKLLYGVRDCTLFTLMFLITGFLSL